MLPTEVIKSKRAAKALSKDEINFFIEGYTKGDIPDYQMASLLMAIFLNGMTSEELVALTQSMIGSGVQLKFENLFPVDKHSTGGVGDKTSLILAPIVAALDIPVPMMSGRGLGHTGGTLDKLESIPGFNVNLDLETFTRQVEDHKLSYIGQTKNICPADKKIYALRDVTGTVESLPLICASIMSKKIAEGIKGLVLDVKVGSGAFMKSMEEARKLADGLKSLAEGNGLVFKYVISNMDQPLGRFVGNALEVGECISILKRENFMGRPHTDFSDTEELSIELSARMISIALKIDEEKAKTKAIETLESGRAFEKFEQICKIQGGDLNQLPMPSKKIQVLANQQGYFSEIDGEGVGLSGISIQAGRKVIDDKINPVTGIEVHKRIGDSVSLGDPIFTIHTDSQSMGYEQAEKRLEGCYKISQQKASPQALILDQG